MPSINKYVNYLALIIFFYFSNVYADPVINLIIDYKKVNFTGKPAVAMAINNQIPAPTLHFKEGQQVTINVYNHLKEGTSLHWHGLIVPWQMDGVEHLSQHPIPPGGVFHYQFTLRQSGTYWYHAHAGLQEQEGLYGAIIIDPTKPPAYHYNKDYVLVLSDWSNTNANQIHANLKKDGDYYSPDFPLQPSLLHLIHDYRLANTPQRQQLISDYKMMQTMRMGIYDLSDVAYDAFLLNGHSALQPWNALVNIGDTVRLRFIGAAANTIYHIKIPGTSMQVVNVDGNDVRPYEVNDFTLAPGETFDVIVKIQKRVPYVIYAESADTLGAAVGALNTSPTQIINYHAVTPFPEPSPTLMPMGDMHDMPNMNHDNASMPGMDMGNMQDMNHDSDYMPSMNMDNMNNQSTATKYEKLIAAVKTNDPNKPIQQTINMKLSGYMDRYIWFINGKTEAQAQSIIFEPGKRYRFIFTNDSMMHHPMHIHGHWFILRNGHGAYDPLLHTIDIAPGETVIADVDADASGQWFFHCHLLYHMMSGMARVFQYSTIIDLAKGTIQPQTINQSSAYNNRPIVRDDAVTPLDPTLINHPMVHGDGFYTANFLEAAASPIQNQQQLSFKGLYGDDFNKLELFTEDAEMNKGAIENADMDIFYWHLLSQFWAIKGGMNYTYRPGVIPYWQPGVGIEGLLPYFIDTNLRTYYHDGSESFDLELSRDSQITNNFFIRTSVRTIFATHTVTADDIGSGLNDIEYTIRPYYRLMPGLSIYTEFEHTHYLGAAENLRRANGDSSIDKSLTAGVFLLF